MITKMYDKYGTLDIEDYLDDLVDEIIKRNKPEKFSQAYINVFAIQSKKPIVMVLNSIIKILSVILKRRHLR